MYKNTCSIIKKQRHAPPTYHSLLEQHDLDIGSVGDEADQTETVDHELKHLVAEERHQVARSVLKHTGIVLRPDKK